MDWQSNFAERKELILSTCSHNQPHAIVVISLGWIDSKLLVADCQMRTTVKNLSENHEIAVIGG